MSKSLTSFSFDSLFPCTAKHYSYFRDISWQLYTNMEFSESIMKQEKMASHVSGSLMVANRLKLVYFQSFVGYSRN